MIGEFVEIVTSEFIEVASLVNGASDEVKVEVVAIGDVDELISVVVGGLVVVTTPGTVVDVGGGEDIDIVGITGVVGTTIE